MQKFYGNNTLTLFSFCPNVSNKIRLEKRTNKNRPKFGCEIDQYKKNAHT